MALGSVPSTKSIQQQSLRFICVQRCLPTRNTLGPSPKGQSSLWLVQILKTLKSTHASLLLRSRKLGLKTHPNTFTGGVSHFQRWWEIGSVNQQKTVNQLLSKPHISSALSTKLVIMTEKVTDSVRGAGATIVFHLSRVVCLILPVGSAALPGDSRFINCTCILLSTYYTLGPLIKHLHFSLWRAGVPRRYPLGASGVRGKFSATEPHSQGQNVSILSSAHHHQTPPRKVISSNRCCWRGIPGVTRNQPARGCSTARNATSASRYLPHPLVMLTTTTAASSRCNNL